MSASTSTALATDTPKLVEDLIANNRIAVFSKSWCPYCKRAKALLANNYADVPAEVIEIDGLGDSKCSEIQDYLLEKTGQRSVPNIFIDQKHIGGSDKLAELQSKGELKALINKL
ncbi:glutaredoxin [Pyrrhoderma noxium]|uniref:Glutaredoxin n=1 Tax=Pyrrhoderma noxium TaxID=2282107 RepID=A0A286UTJ6_9AGAM|nr:glutaredoxin [Pyrrhoderma noxium]